MPEVPLADREPVGWGAAALRDRELHLRPLPPVPARGRREEGIGQRHGWGERREWVRGRGERSGRHAGEPGEGRGEEAGGVRRLGRLPPLPVEEVEAEGGIVAHARGAAGELPIEVHRVAGAPLGLEEPPRPPLRLRLVGLAVGGDRLLRPPLGLEDEPGCVGSRRPGGAVGEEGPVQLPGPFERAAVLEVDPAIPGDGGKVPLELRERLLRPAEGGEGPRPFERGLGPPDRGEHGQGLARSPSLRQSGGRPEGIALQPEDGLDRVRVREERFPLPARLGGPARSFEGPREVRPEVGGGVEGEGGAEDGHRQGRGPVGEVPPAEGDPGLPAHAIVTVSQ